MYEVIDDLMLLSLGHPCKALADTRNNQSPVWTSLFIFNVIHCRSNVTDLYVCLQCLVKSSLHSLSWHEAKQRTLHWNSKQRISTSMSSSPSPPPLFFLSFSLSLSLSLTLLLRNMRGNESNGYRERGRERERETA